MERTLSILKPDVTRRNLTGAVNERIESANLRIIAQRRIQLTLEQAQKFYAVHRERSFYNDLCSFIISSYRRISRGQHVKSTAINGMCFLSR